MAASQAFDKHIPAAIAAASRGGFSTRLIESSTDKGES
jgi:hypothetical protein